MPLKNRLRLIRRALSTNPTPTPARGGVARGTRHMAGQTGGGRSRSEEVRAELALHNLHLTDDAIATLERMPPMEWRREIRTLALVTAIHAVQRDTSRISFCVEEYARARR